MYCSYIWRVWIIYLYMTSSPIAKIYQYASTFFSILLVVKTKFRDLPENFWAEKQVTAQLSRSPSTVHATPGCHAAQAELFFSVTKSNSEKTSNGYEQ